MSDELYPRGRLSAPLARPGSTHEIRRDLIEALRAIRREGDDDVIGIDRYDPDFSVKLSACDNREQAQPLLDEWLRKRVSVLELTRNRLLRAWSQGVREMTPDS